jgi:hypothetical protein
MNDESSPEAVPVDFPVRVGQGFEAMRVEVVDNEMDSSCVP